MMKKEQKYAVLKIDVECGGEAWLDSLTKEKVLEEIGYYNSYNTDSQGVTLYNDGEGDFSSTVILSEKGLKEMKEALKNAKPFDIKSIKINDLLNNDVDSDDF